MRDVDYVKLSEQYAGFLIAIGGVSITVLSIVSSIGNRPASAEEIDSFLFAALIVATVSCFIGAHMMAETAAFNNYFKDKQNKNNDREQENTNKEPAQGKQAKVEQVEFEAGEGLRFGKRLFLLASTNIFISVNLVLFAIVLLPAAKTGSFNVYSPIYFMIFAAVGLGALLWMYLASKYRMPVPGSQGVVIVAVTTSGGWIFFLGFIVPRGHLLFWTFSSIVAFTVATLIYFALIFKGSNKDPGKNSDKGPILEVSTADTSFFGTAVSVCSASLVVAAIRIMFGQ